MRIAARLLLSIALLVSLKASAQERSTTTEVRPGLSHSLYALPGPNVVNVVAIPLHDARYRVISFRPESLTTVTRQVDLARSRGMKVVAAINADFFSFQTHLPMGVQASQGRVIHAAPSSCRSQVAFAQSGSPIMDRQQFSGSFRVGQGAWIKLDGLNCPLDSVRIVLYDSSAGGRLRIPADARLLTLRTIDATWSPEDTLVFVASGRPRAVGDPWTPRQVVLAFSPYALIAEPGVGDTVRIVLSLGGKHIGLAEAVGGGGRILLDGTLAGDSIQALESIGRKFTTDRHPRTFVAIDRDTTKLFLCVVDGRQPTSVGMNFREMGEFLLRIGGWNAVNLDGGGSTAMLVEKSIVNRPSDRTGERAVANTLMIIEKDEER